MKTRIALYGALRDADPSGHVDLDIPAGCDIAGLRQLLIRHLRQHAPGIGAELVERSAFASAEEILHDARSVPEGVELAVLPPVSGG